MLQVRRDSDLGQKSLDAKHRAELGEQHLERDLPVVPNVFRQIHRCHAATPELTLDPVAVGKGSGQPAGGGRHVANIAL